ncbi:MAG: hypothetical protein QF535_17665 [Anaerolineales bacterium]|nr:hypothetical protein [Anaerolineales bacterium]
MAPPASAYAVSATSVWKDTKKMDSFPLFLKAVVTSNAFKGGARTST